MPPAQQQQKVPNANGAVQLQNAGARDAGVGLRVPAGPQERVGNSGARPGLVQAPDREHGAGAGAHLRSGLARARVPGAVRRIVRGVTFGLGARLFIFYFLLKADDCENCVLMS